MIMLASDVVIDRPGVYDMTNDVYQRDPVAAGSLSSSGARKLLPPSCPALYRWWVDHGSEHKREYDLGHAAHRYVLGVGEDLVVVDADDWRTKAARQARDEAYEAGQTPLLAAEHDTVLAMAAALREHPVASALFDPASGEPEKTLVWQDETSGVWRRARLDWLRYNATASGRLIVPDYKTTNSADPAHLARAMHNFGYHQQGGWYLDGVLALFHVPDAAFVLVAQERTPPYLVTVCEPDATALKVGRRLNRQAIELYAKCRAEDRWPGYTDDVEPLALPVWVEREQLGDPW